MTFGFSGNAEEISLYNEVCVLCAAFFGRQIGFLPFFGSEIDSLERCGGIGIAWFV